MDVFSGLVLCGVVVVCGVVVELVAKNIITHYFDEHAEYDERVRKILFDYTRESEQAKYVERTKDVV
jgi:hypothetical protein